jgi:epoxyqueuosine reductase QueG
VSEPSECAPHLDAAAVKTEARRLGADAVGIADVAVLNAHPPDSGCPQTPARIWPEARSCVAFAKRIPAGAFRARSMACVHHVDQLVLREMDKIAYRLARFLEARGHRAFQVAAQETVWEYKNGSYGALSTRHAAIEAGLGTLGLELNLLTPECGPRCYTTAVLTDAALVPDGKLTAQICVGEACSRCLYSCPADAILHWNLDKRGCATLAQEFGFATILRLFRQFAGASTPVDRLAILAGHEWLGVWQGLLRVVGAFGDCPRCLAVCPVGDDYHRFLKEDQREIPEKTRAKVGRARELLQIRRRGEMVAGLAAGRIRWIGEAGYQPPGRRPVAPGRP